MVLAGRIIMAGWIGLSGWIILEGCVMLEDFPAGVLLRIAARRNIDPDLRRSVDTNTW